MLKRLDELQKTLESFREDLTKMSNYGPKKGGQYTPADNARRKANNTGDQTGFGHNVNTKSYSTKPGQLSAKAQVALEVKKLKPGPVKTLSAEEIKAQYPGQKVTKQEEATTPHGYHDPGPLPGKAPLLIQIEEEKKLKADGKTVELLDFNKCGQWSMKTK